MTMQTDVLAISLAASGAITGSRARIRSLILEPGALAGSVVIKDGGASGTTLFTINVLASGQPFNVLIPGEGILCSTSAYAVLTNAKLTAFYS